MSTGPPRSCKTRPPLRASALRSAEPGTAVACLAARMSAITTIPHSATLHRREVEAGKRFDFGKNWQVFLRSVDDGRIAAAEASLLSMLRSRDLAGKSFLDIGCGSGLFSLAARRQGARVHSVDFDVDSVACAR